MAEQRFLWSVLPCLMAWPTVAMPVPHAAGLQVGAAPPLAACACAVSGSQPAALSDATVLYSWPSCIGAYQALRSGR